MMYQISSLIRQLPCDCAAHVMTASLLQAQRSSAYTGIISCKNIRIRPVYSVWSMDQCVLVGQGGTYGEKAAMRNGGRWAAVFGV